MYPTPAEFKELVLTPPVSMEEFTNLMQVWLARTAAMQAKDLAAEADGLRKVVRAVEVALGVKRGPGPWDPAVAIEVLVGEILALQGKALNGDLLDRAVRVATESSAHSGTVYDVGEIVRRACQAPCARCAEEMEAAREATAPLFHALTSWSLSWSDETSVRLTPERKWAMVGDRIKAVLEAVRYLSKELAARQRALEGIASHVEATTKDFV